MVQLIIDGQQVYLPNDLNFDYYIANPLFTKNGEYSYDIDIPLNIPENAKLYAMANRLDISRKFKNRKAVLICDAQTVVNGTEVILSIDNEKAKIQIVGGNSELNYFSAGDRKIRTLDLGTIPQIDANSAKNTLGKFYPDTPYVFCPVIKEKGVFNLSEMEPKTDILYNELNWDTRNGYKYKSNTTFVAQPFLLYYVEKIITALGYNILENNLIKNKLATQLIVVNGLKTNELNKILPDWTIDEFIDEIEKMFNVIFLVDNNGVDVSIINVPQFYKGANQVYVDGANVIQSFEKKYDQNESLYITYDNVRYNLPSDRWYKYQKVDEEVKENAIYKEVSDFESVLNIVGEDRKRTIAHDKTSKLDFVFSRESSADGQATFSTIVPIDALKDIINENSNNSTEMKIVPAEIYGNNVYLGSADFGGSKYYDGWITAATPVVSNVQEVETQEYLFQEIENGVQESETIDSNIFVAIYAGELPYMYSSWWQDEQIPQPELDKIIIPQCVVIPYFVHYRSAAYHPMLTQLVDKSFSLSLVGENGMYNTLYSDAVNVDTSTEYTISFVEHRKLDPKKIFNIMNKLFYCKELHYTVSNKGFNEIVEGTFYPI